MRKNLFLKVGLLVALMMTMYACDKDKPETPDPEKKPGIEVGTEQSNLRGVEVVVEAVDLRSGTSYSFTPRGKGGDVELEGAGFHAAKEGTNIVPIKLDFYAKKDIIFKGWSWRYAKDGVKPIEKAVALQTKDGMQALGVTRTIRADHTVDTKVYVRVEYISSPTPIKTLPEMLYELFPVGEYQHILGSGATQREIAQTMLDIIDFYNNPSGGNVLLAPTPESFAKVANAVKTDWEYLNVNVNDLLREYYLNYTETSYSQYLLKYSSLVLPKTKSLMDFLGEAKNDAQSTNYFETLPPFRRPQRLGGKTISNEQWKALTSYYQNCFSEAYNRLEAWRARL